MKRFLVILSLVVPISLLLLFWLVPEIDPHWHQPLLHFYLVTFFTFAALVVGLFTAVLLGQQSLPRHRLLATAFAAMGAIFFVHGVTTPEAILFTFNPGVRWAAWLTLFTGGLVFALAALDSPQRPLKLRHLRLIHWALAIFWVVFVLIVAFGPQWLAAIDAQAAPGHERLIALITLLFWLFATVRLARTWRQTDSRVDGAMALVAAWLALGTISMHGFANWQLSWWFYHIHLLLGAILALVVLILEYEQLRRFRLTYYYGATGLIISAALALLASHFFSRMVEQYLVQQIAESEMIAAVTRARLDGLLIAGLSMGLLYALMLVIVRRADRLITIHNNELAQAYANLQAAEAMRDDLTDMVVHDLRSPLTSLNLSINLLDKTPDASVRRQEIVVRAQSSIQQMMSLINELLDVARLETGQLQLNPAPMQITTLLAEKAAEFRPLAEISNKQIQVETSPALPAVSADAGLISRVLDNLISNALKYTGGGGHIILQAARNNHTLTIQVVDDGEGVDPTVAGRIFDKFYQVRDESGTPLRRGTGLGLAFCKLVVEAHHGRIWVESTPGKGSNFCFSLPFEETVFAKR